MEIESGMHLDMDRRVIGSVGECMEYCRDRICSGLGDGETPSGKSVLRGVP